MAVLSSAAGSLENKHPTGHESAVLNLMLHYHTFHEALMSCSQQKQAQLICRDVNQKQPIGHVLA